MDIFELSNQIKFINYSNATKMQAEGKKTIVDPMITIEKIPQTSSYDSDSGFLGLSPRSWSWIGIACLIVWVISAVLKERKRRLEECDQKKNLWET